MAGRTVKTILITAAVLVVLAGVVTLQAWRQYQAFLAQPLTIPDDGVVFVVEAGAGGNAVVRDLAARGLTETGWTWKLLLRLEPVVFRAGEYRLDTGMLPQDVVWRLASGRVVQYRFTIVEGWTFRQLLEALAADHELVHELPLNDSGSWDFGELFPELEHPEGWFLPETYQFTRGDSDRDLLLWAHQSMQDALAEAWQSRDTGLPLETPYDLLILASIIEKETALPHERGQIAGVFVRRLLKGMRLQTDPTVIYGLGEAFDGDIRRRDLTTDTPYNTYTRHGLPPTPIALPGRAALDAAAHPEPGDTLFFVANGDGGHTFSRTLEEHQQAVKRLIEKTR
jgi:UPF0755 protein